MASFLADPNSPTTPRLFAAIFLDDQIGSEVTGGVLEAAFTDLDAFLELGEDHPAEVDWSHDNLIAAGIRNMGYWWYAGRQSPGYSVGNYPHAYFDQNSQGGELICSPQTETQHNTMVGDSSFLDQIEPALDTAGRKGALYRMLFYAGAVPANSATDNTTLDSHFAIPVTLGAEVAHDVQAVIAYKNQCTPGVMGSSVIGWWEANRTAYSDAGTTPVTADGFVRQWNAIKGGINWSQATLANRPQFKTNQINGYPSLRFDGVDAFMQLAAAEAMGAAFTIAMVVKMGSADSFLLSDLVANRQVRLNELVAGGFSFFNGTDSVHSAASSFTADTWCIVRFRCSANALKFWVNGTEKGNLFGDTFGTGLTLDCLGSFHGTSGFLTGDIAAVVMCDAAATNNEIALIEAYWADKYGIAVAGSPVLPHKAYFDRQVSLGRFPYSEPFGVRTVADLDGWVDAGAGQIAGVVEVAAAIADPTRFYTKDTMTGRAGALLINNNTVAERTALALQYLELGYDVHVDFGGFTTAQINSLVASYEGFVASFSLLRTNRLPRIGRVDRINRFGV